MVSQGHLGLWTILLFCHCSQTWAQPQQLVQWQMAPGPISSSGDSISLPTYDASQWYNVSVPSTVLASLVEAGALPDDLYYGRNLEKVPPEQFDAPRWYRIEIHQPPISDALLTLKGVNYRGVVWSNGQLLQTCIGTFWHCDVILPASSADDVVVLAVEVYRPHDYIWNKTALDLAITFVDWAPQPPDSNMGLWQPVELSSNSEDLSAVVRFPGFNSVIHANGSATANLTVEVFNYGPTDISGQLTVEVVGVGTCKFWATAPKQASTTLRFSGKGQPCLTFDSPQLWWPWQMGDQYMYNTTLQLVAGSKSTPTVHTRLGIRTVESTLDDQGSRRFHVNGLPVQVRGGGYSPDLLLRFDLSRAEEHFQYVRDLGLNAIRLEGKFEVDEFYSLADDYGIMVLPGWCCCDAWQHWSLWGEEQMEVAKGSLTSVVQRLRQHPSMLVFMYGSDENPPVNVESMFLSVFRSQSWPAAHIAAASKRNSSITGPTGVKMAGPYAWVPPNYWEDPEALVNYGGPLGFSTEISPGATPMTINRWKATVPADKVWPINDYWDYHCGSEHGLFGSLDHFKPALDARYGASQSAEDFLRLSQLATYEAQRAMFESYACHPAEATGIVQWMLNNAYTQHIWHLFDAYMDSVNGAYYGTKKGLESFHVQASHFNSTVWLINSLYDSHVTNITVTATWCSVASGKVHSQSSTHHVAMLPGNSALQVFVAEPPALIGEVALLQLVANGTQSTGEGSEVQSRNVYWLPRHKDILNWSNSTFYQTPCSKFADLTALERLPHSTVAVKAHTVEPGVAEVTLTAGDVISFFVELRAFDTESKEVMPSRWSDNYVILFPFQSATLTVRFDPSLTIKQVSVHPFNSKSAVMTAL